MSSAGRPRQSMLTIKTSMVAVLSASPILPGSRASLLFCLRASATARSTAAWPRKLQPAAGTPDSRDAGLPDYRVLSGLFYRLNVSVFSERDVLKSRFIPPLVSCLQGQQSQQGQQSYHNPFTGPPPPSSQGSGQSYSTQNPLW